MRVRFLTDFRGKLTAERFYRAGDVINFPSPIAQQLIAEGRAEKASRGGHDSAAHTPKHDEDNQTVDSPNGSAVESDHTPLTARINRARQRRAESKNEGVSTNG